ncbi:hypothetical protein EH31_16435 [Erythrobacter longus]|uniref:Uncharacterized protein n=1 Tax=Erythrobacter longus TaxID=1044 RepID=A0A074M243_ERYLO|nr:hypothetical protein EH31_16435 [Erythrobacter longus]
MPNISGESARREGFLPFQACFCSRPPVFLRLYSLHKAILLQTSKVGFIGPEPRAHPQKNHCNAAASLIELLAEMSLLCVGE